METLRPLRGPRARNGATWRSTAVRLTRDLSCSKLLRQIYGAIEVVDGSQGRTMQHLASSTLSCELWASTRHIDRAQGGSLLVFLLWVSSAYT